MSPIDWATRPLKNYAGFTGRAPRAEFWWYVLLILVLVIVAKIIEDAVGLTPLFGFYGPISLVLLAATFVPTLAAQVRRLHDTARSGYWMVAFYIPYCAYVYLALGAKDQIAAMQAGQPMPPGMGSLAMTGVVALVMFVLAVILLIFFVLGGTKGPNKYGDDPYAGA